MDLWKERWTGCNVYPLTVFTSESDVDVYNLKLICCESRR